MQEVKTKFPSPGNPFAKQDFWLSDGGLATELEKAGFDLKHPLWSAKVLGEDAMAIYKVHRSYLSAGSGIISTSSYQASIDGLMKHMKMGRPEAEAVLRFTVEIACRARDDFYREEDPQHSRNILIGASVGPYGAILANGAEYTGDYDVGKPEVGDYYAHKIEHLILPRKNVKADFLAFETIPTRKEAELISVVLKTIPWAKAWISFSRVEALIEALPKLEKNDQVPVVGLNCVSPKVIDENLVKLRKLTSKKIIVYPNGGGSYDAVTKSWNENGEVAGDDAWMASARRWKEAGADIIGGCCRTGPNEIRAMAKI